MEEFKQNMQKKGLKKCMIKTIMEFCFRNVFRKIYFTGQKIENLK